MTILLAGGGTAGHVTPLLAVADAIGRRDPEETVLVLGTAEGLEARLVPDRGYELATIERLPFPRKPGAYALRFPVRFQRAVKQIRRLIRERDVDVLIGFGGYASAPAYLAAKQERVPFVVHEANARPGLANILGARWAAGVGVAFEGTPIKHAQTVGMPLRAEIAELDRAQLRPTAAEHYGLDPDRQSLLVFGGSLGAKKLNDTIVTVVDDLLAAGYQVVHIVGDRWEGPEPARDGYVQKRYEDRMDLAYAIADVIVCRSGAASVSEVSALGIPAVYIPYPVGNGEQRLNAGPAVAAGAAVIVDDDAFTPERVRHDLIALMGDDDRLGAMRLAAERSGSREGVASVLRMMDHARAVRSA